MSETERVQDPRRYLAARDELRHHKISIMPIPDHLMHANTTFAQRPPMKHLKVYSKNAST